VSQGLLSIPSSPSLLRFHVRRVACALVPRLRGTRGGVLVPDFTCDHEHGRGLGGVTPVSCSGCTRFLESFQHGSRPGPGSAWRLSALSFHFLQFGCCHECCAAAPSRFASDPV
jgi:hypothetical protein